MAEPPSVAPAPKMPPHAAIVHAPPAVASLTSPSPSVAALQLQSIFAMQPPQAGMDIQSNLWTTLLQAASKAAPAGQHMAMHPQQLAQATWAAKAAATAALAAQPTPEQHGRHVLSNVPQQAAALGLPVGPEGAVDFAALYAQGFKDAMRLAAVQHQQHLVQQQMHARAHQRSPPASQKQQAVGGAAGGASRNPPAPPPPPPGVAPGATLPFASPAGMSATLGATAVLPMPAPHAGFAARCAGAAGSRPNLYAAIPSSLPSGPSTTLRKLREGNVWQTWALVLGAKDRNNLIRQYNLTKNEEEHFKRTSRKLKQNMAQQRYLRRQHAHANGEGYWNGEVQEDTANGICSIRNCTTAAKTRGRCGLHGGNGKKVCKVEGCSTFAHARSLCFKHGANGWRQFDGCTSGPTNGSHCIKHGGKRKKPCSVDGCLTTSERRGLCCKHGGSMVKCCIPGCTSKSVSGTILTCHRHGGRGYCKFEGCWTPAARKDGNCTTHTEKSNASIEVAEKVPAV